jgi:chemotaxis response regulator CheB
MDCVYCQKTAVPIRVLVVDDSSFLRAQLVKTLAWEPAMGNVGAAAGGRVVVAAAIAPRSNAATLGVEISQLNDFAAVRQSTRLAATRSVRLSAFTQAESESTRMAPAAGALDFIAKASWHAMGAGSTRHARRQSRKYLARGVVARTAAWSLARPSLAGVKPRAGAAGFFLNVLRSSWVQPRVVLPDGKSASRRARDLSRSAAASAAACL